MTVDILSCVRCDGFINKEEGGARYAKNKASMPDGAGATLRKMIIKKCTFDELPSAMKSHIMFIRKIPVGEYRLAIWSCAEYHRKEILNILDNTEDSWILWQIHRFAVNMTEEDD